MKYTKMDPKSFPYEGIWVMTAYAVRDEDGVGIGTVAKARGYRGIEWVCRDARGALWTSFAATRNEAALALLFHAGGLDHVVGGSWISDSKTIV